MLREFGTGTLANTIHQTLNTAILPEENSVPRVDFATADVNEALFKRLKDQLQKPVTKTNPLYPVAPTPPSDPSRSPPLITELNFKYSLESCGERSGKHVFFDLQKRDAIKEIFCCNLYGMLDSYASRSNGPASCLDSLLSSIVLEGHLYDYGQFDYYCDLEEIVAEACYLLSRLPPASVELPDAPNILASEYINPAAFASERYPQARVWENLEVVKFKSTNVIRVALLVAMNSPSTTYLTLEPYLNLHADLCSTASRLYGLAVSEEEKCKWFLVRAFLWTSWQRMSQLYFYSVAGDRLSTGFLEFYGPIPILRAPQPMPDMSSEEMSRELTIKNKPHYMCSYAFELIRTNPCALGLDFRNFMDHYSAIFGQKDGRCLPGKVKSCEGEDPTSCLRFRGMKIHNQSAHDNTCDHKCEKLTWDRDSYVAVNGARAVKLANCPSNGKLIYQRASNRTLAISHVWSHGQGGRPEKGYGLNICLHRRYKAVAESLGCDSYWMDTACIPEDHRLRREAIMKINEVFEESKMTIVCDRDLMSINAREPSVAMCETILVTMMVCDWNLRAWTFLEAFRARDKIHILCADNKTVPFKEIADTVYREGSIDLALFILAIPHLLAGKYGKNTEKASRDKLFGHLKSGFMSLESSATLLSAREASRPGDDIVIWSLLMGNEVSPDAETFWVSKQEEELSLDFLLSSSARMKKRGWRWAPLSPTVGAFPKSSTDGGTRNRLQASEPGGGQRGQITKDGLRGIWYIHTFLGGLPGSAWRTSRVDWSVDTVDVQKSINLRRIQRKYLRGYLVGALLSTPGPLSDKDHLENREGSSKLHLVVAGTKSVTMFRGGDDRVFWTWRGIWEWDPTEKVPEFELQRDIYLV